MPLRSRNGQAAREAVPSSSTTVSHSKRKETNLKSLPRCRWLLFSTYIWIRDLLYYLMLFILLSMLFIIIASPFIIDTHRRSADYYNVLGVTPLASRADIKAAYKRLSLEHHPDKMASNSPEGKAYLRIQEAYEALNVEDHVRCMYDLMNDIEGRWSVSDCILARKEYTIRVELRRQEELGKTRQKVEMEKKERQQRREERLRQ